MPSIVQLREILYAAAKARQQNRSYTADLFYASELGDCHRRLYFRRAGVEARERIPRNLFKMDDGSGIHARFQADLTAAGILLKSEHLVVDKKNGIQGHPDGIIAIEGERLLEIKTINSEKFATIIIGPAEEHYIQANFYALIEHLNLIHFLYYCTDNGKTKEFVVKPDSAIYQQAVEKINMVRYFLEAQIVPVDTIENYCFCCEFSYMCKKTVQADKKAVII